MKVTKKSIDELNLQLTVALEAADYAEAIKKKTTEIRRNADIKGFRKGMVPASLIQKLYGEQILGDAVNQAVGEALDAYIKKNSLHLLGEPLPAAKQKEQEWKNGNDFTFVFDAALSPALNFEVEATDAIDKYKVTVSADDKKKMFETLKKIESERKAPEGETLEPKTDEQLQKDAEERLEEQFKQESDWRLSKDIRNFYMNKAGIALPEAFLKRWLVAVNNGKFTMEQVEKEFPAFAEDFKWQLVRGYLMDKFSLKIEQKDIEQAAEAFVAYQYAMYGIGGVPAEMIKEAAKNVLSDEKQVDRLVESVEDEKVLAKIRETVSVKDKKITSAKFRELK